MHSGPVRPKQRPCPNACGNSILRKDHHDACVNCLGLQHARVALDSPQRCPACSRFSPRTLQERFDSFGLSLEPPLPSHSDPLLSELVLSEDDEAHLRSWAVGAAAPAPAPTPAADSDDCSSLEADTNMECGDGDTLFPLTQISPTASTAVSLCDEAISSEQSTSANKLFLDTCQRAAQRLGVAWPQPPLARTTNRLDGNFLPPLAPSSKSLVPPFQDCLDDVVKTWGKPYSNRVVIGGFGALSEMEGALERGLSDCPRVEQSIASYLAPGTNTGMSSSSQLPHKQPKFSSQQLDKTFKVLGQAARAQNSVSLLLAYVAELQAEVGVAIDENKPVKELWAEIRTAMDFVMRTTRCSNQAIGRAMGLTVVAQRHLWLNLSNIPDKERHVFLDAPVDPAGLFGSAVNAMQARCESKKMQDEAFSYCLPRKTIAQPRGAAVRHPTPLQRTSAGPARQWNTTGRTQPPVTRPAQSPTRAVQSAWTRRPATQFDAGATRGQRPLAKKKRTA